jgi:hypothetical protein
VRAHLCVAALALLLLALPLLLGAVALETVGLPHEGLAAATTRDVSAAALDRLERYLHGDLSVALEALSVAALADRPDAEDGRARGSAPEHLGAFPAPASVTLRL